MQKYVSCFIFFLFYISNKNYTFATETVISELAVSQLKKYKEMRFYDREQEIERLLQIREQSLHNAQFTVVTGRRRIGKTQLLLKATEGVPTLYFFVSRKAEHFLCQDFQQEIYDKLSVGYWDRTGAAAYNQTLSQNRPNQKYKITKLGYIYLQFVKDNSS